MRPTTAGSSSGLNLARVPHAVEHADGGGQRVGDLLHRRGPRLLEVVAAHVDRVPLGRLAHRVGDGVDGEAQARAGREDVGPPAQVLLDDVVLCRARQQGRVDALVLRVGHVEPEQPRRGGVDRHGGVHRLDGDALEQLPHVAQVRHRDAHLADLAGRLGGVGVVPGLGRQVEGDGEAGLPLGQVGAVELVGGPSGRMARVGPHHPWRITLRRRRGWSGAGPGPGSGSVAIQITSRRVGCATIVPGFGHPAAPMASASPTRPSSAVVVEALLGLAAELP